MSDSDRIADGIYYQTVKVWAAPDSVCLGAFGKENARRIRALSAEIVRLREWIDDDRYERAIEARERDMVDP